MPTTQCKCGEQLHYTDDKVGLIARCRCGRPVRLPAPKPQPKPKSERQLFDEERRALNVRRQILAVLLVLVVTVAAVMLFQLRTTLSEQQPRQQYDPADDEPP
jgi:hypothetical protein